MALISGYIFAMVLLQPSFAEPDPSGKKVEDLPIRYPGPVKAVDTDRYILTEEDVPEDCRNLTYCTIKPKNYPDEVIREIFNNKKVQVGPPELQIEEIVIGNRQGDPEEEDNCPSDVRYEPIYKIKGENSTWLNVIQAPELSYEQKVRTETCKEAGSGCFLKVATFPQNIRTKCVQQFSTWSLKALDKNNKVVDTTVEIHSCCSCHYEYI